MTDPREGLPLGVNKEGEALCLVCGETFQVGEMALPVYPVEKRWFGQNIRRRFAYHVHLNCVRNNE